MERELTAKLLVIEGKRAERASFVGGLAKKGFRVVSVPSGNTALTRLANEPFDLITVDADSMRTSGKRICQTLKEKFTEIPLILIVGENVDPKDGFEADVILVLPFTLQKLLNRIKVLLDRGELFRYVWETGYTGDTRTLDVHISWLRQALEQDPRHPDYIKTVRGVGYRLDLD